MEEALTSGLAKLLRSKRTTLRPLQIETNNSPRRSPDSYSADSV
ncbi:unnamed protein product [Acidithrix sp. C25]|nr:unnamed protein product [Acidithrix sp. C25]